MSNGRPRRVDPGFSFDGTRRQRYYPTTPIQGGTMSNHSRRLPFALVVLASLVAAAMVSGADEKKPEPNPSPWMIKNHFLISGYLTGPVTFEGGIKAHGFTLSKPDGSDRFILTLDQNRRSFDVFGDMTGTTEIAPRKIPVTLKPIKMDDPKKQERRVYAIDAENLTGRLVLVVPASDDGPFSLVVRDKELKVEAVIPLHRSPPPIPKQPCHPGCFPAGTIVETPSGARPIETIRVGDVVLNVTADGKTVPLKVASVFVGESRLVEVDTDKGKLITTGKQPLTLAGGRIKSSGELEVGDEIMRWRDQPAKVRGIHTLEKPDRVFNLVLEERGTFIANGYLVRSKPPVEP
jgi:hypothetical protein